jgi:hypothetical protein
VGGGVGGVPWRGVPWQAVVACVGEEGVEDAWFTGWWLYRNNGAVLGPDHANAATSWAKWCVMLSPENIYGTLRLV